MKFWLISDTDTGVLLRELAAAQGMCGDEAQRKVAKALYVLETGLHKTDAVPDDFKGTAQ